MAARLKLDCKHIKFKGAEVSSWRAVKKFSIALLPSGRRRAF